MGPESGVDASGTRLFRVSLQYALGSAKVTILWVFVPPSIALAEKNPARGVVAIQVFRGLPEFGGGEAMRVKLRIRRNSFGLGFALGRGFSPATCGLCAPRWAAPATAKKTKHCDHLGGDDVRPVPNVSRPTHGGGNGGYNDIPNIDPPSRVERA